MKELFIERSFTGGAFVAALVAAVLVAFSMGAHPLHAEAAQIGQAEELDAGMAAASVSTQMQGPSSSTDAYAILYANGDLVFQRGSAPDGSSGHMASDVIGGPWTGFEEAVYSYGIHREGCAPWLSEGGDDIKSVSFRDRISPISLDYWFYGCGNLTQCDLNNLDSSSVTSMGGTFGACSSLKSLDLSGLDTSQVRYMHALFSSCTSLKSLNISHIDTSNVVSMRFLFSHAKSLSSLDLSAWDTSNVQDMHCMFDGCESLVSLNVSGWDTSKVTEDASRGVGMDYMFRDCASLESLDFSTWNMSNVSNADSMFYNCASLESLTLGERFRFPVDSKFGSGSQRDSFAFWVGSAGEKYAEDSFASCYDGSTGMVGSWQRKLDLYPAEISVSSMTYSGSKLEPKPTVVRYGKTLSPKVDYSVSYSGNVDAGTATLTIRGKGSYIGAKSVKFEVGRADMKNVAASKVVAKSYSGKAVKPTLKLTYQRIALKENTDYKVSYKNSKGAVISASKVKAAGSYYAVVTGAGNYKGSKSLAFTISKAANPMKASPVAKAVKLPKGKKALAKPATVSGAVKFSKKAQGKVTYSKASRSSALSVNKSSGKVTVAKGTKAGTYSVKVDVKAAGNANYKAKTQRVTVKVKVK